MHAATVPKEDEDMAENTTAAPRRTRAAAAKPAAAKATPTKAAAKPVAKPTEAPATEPLKVELVHEGTTKTYEKFGFDPSYRGTLVGNVYAPLGTARVIVAVVPGAEEASE